MSESITFGYINAWAKGGLKSTIEEEVQLPDGIMLSGSINVPPAMAQQLIEYLSNPANADQYGTKLDLALFYKEDGKVQIGGKLTTPYKKGTTSTSTTTKARRTL